jgi:predicted nucleic acid-binding protein
MLAEELDVRGLRIFDLQIALAAFDNGATEIWTHDRNFVAVPGMLVRDPL